MKKILASLALGLCATAAVAADSCAPGDKKCGPDGMVMKCEKLTTYMDSKWYGTGDRCKGPAADSQGSSTFNRNDNNNREVCSEGKSRCGADKKVERCRNGVWEREFDRC